MAPKLIITPDTPLNARLVQAVQNGDLEAMQQLLDQGASADTRVGWEDRPDSMPIALLATRFLSEDKPRLAPIFTLLVRKATLPNAADESGETLLMAAADMDDLEAVKWLVSKGAAINARKTRAFAGANALVFAAMQDGNTGKDPSHVTLFLLDHGAEVNVQDEFGNSPLIHAAQYGKVETVKALLAHGADTSLRNKYGFTALGAAKASGRAAIIPILIDRTPLDLYEAAQFGKTERVRACLDAGESPDGSSTFGTTPLMEAMESGSAATVNLLLDRGAQINAQDKSGHTALHYAVEHDDLTLATLLLDRGANVTPPPQAYSSTPLTLAVGQVNAKMVDLLLRRGVDLTQNKQGEMALELAIQTSAPRLHHPRAKTISQRKAWREAQKQIILWLIAHGADVRANHSRVVYLAASEGESGLVSLLLQRGGDVNGRKASSSAEDNGGGATALMGALSAWSSASNKHSGALPTVQENALSFQEETERDRVKKEARKTVDLLIARGADVNETDQNGQTPLMLCVSYDFSEAAQLLLRKGANVNAANRKGRTALMQAAADNQVDMAELLLKYRANVNKRDVKGITALMLAIDDGSNADYITMREEENEHLRDAHGENPPPVSLKDLPNPSGHPELVRLLLQQHGIDVNAASADGTTALKLAQKNKFRAVITMLQDAGAR